MDAFFPQLLNGLDKGGAYALIALGLTLIFGTLGVVNFSHGALFMLGGMSIFGFQWLVGLSQEVPTGELSPWGTEVMAQVPYLQTWLGEGAYAWISEYSLLLGLIPAVLIVAGYALALERGLIRFFYKRPHSDQILVTFGMAIVLQEVVKHIVGANALPVDMPKFMKGTSDVLGVSYPTVKLIYIGFSAAVIAAVFAFINMTRFGMVVRGGMEDRQMVSLLGINIERRFTIVFAIGAIVAGLAGAMASPFFKPSYDIGMTFLTISFVVVVVGGMGSLEGAVLAGFVLGIVESFASLPVVTSIIPALDQIILYLVAVVVLLVRPRGLLGKKGVMES